MTTKNSFPYITAVPVYKAIPSKTEAFSLLQLRALHVENVTLICPEDLDLGVYLDLWPDLKITRFAKQHFQSIQTYNDFVMSPIFYEAFANQYQWLLIYQLDAFLLKNDILEFCELGYDYYGAPWVTGFPQYHFLFNRWPIKLNAKRFYVGNGGLSLRKIHSTLDLLKRKKAHISQNFFMEDAFFGYWGSRDPSFHACPPDIAAAFSFEAYPEHWLKITGSLPMGFHGFKVWGKDFYNPLLQERYATLRQSYPKLENL